MQKQKIPKPTSCEKKKDSLHTNPTQISYVNSCHCIIILSTDHCLLYISYFLRNYSALTSSCAY